MVAIIAKCTKCDWQVDADTFKGVQQVFISARTHVNRTDHVINIIAKVSPSQ